MLTIWTDEQGRLRVNLGQLLRRAEACEASRARWKVLCFVILGGWFLTLGAGLWTAGRADQRQRAAVTRITTWLGEERARTRCLEALLHQAAPTKAEIVTLAGRAQWVSRCVKRELERNS